MSNATSQKSLAVPAGYTDVKSGIVELLYAAQGMASN